MEKESITAMVQWESEERERRTMASEEKRERKRLIDVAHAFERGALAREDVASGLIEDKTWGAQRLVETQRVRSEFFATCVWQPLVVVLRARADEPLGIEVEPDAEGRLVVRKVYTSRLTAGALRDLRADDRIVRVNAAHDPQKTLAARDGAPMAVVVERPIGADAPRPGSGTREETPLALAFGDVVVRLQAVMLVGRGRHHVGLDDWLAEGADVSRLHAVLSVSRSSETKRGRTVTRYSLRVRSVGGAGTFVAGERVPHDGTMLVPVGAEIRIGSGQHGGRVKARVVRYESERHALVDLLGEMFTIKVDAEALQLLKRCRSWDQWVVCVRELARLVQCYVSVRALELRDERGDVIGVAKRGTTVEYACHLGPTCPTCCENNPFDPRDVHPLIQHLRVEYSVAWMESRRSARKPR